MANFSPSREFAEQLDRQDKLAPYREQFVVNDPDLIYLDGNSWGCLSKSVIERIENLREKYLTDPVMDRLDQIE